MSRLRYVVTFFLCLLCLPIILAIQVTRSDAAAVNTSFNGLVFARQKRFFNSIRLLPVGDSITEGYGSSDGSGYRKALYNKLNALTPNVDFIGSRSNGNFPENQHEGFGGYKIQQIRDSLNADRQIFQHPNVVLVHAGTNDLWHGDNSEYSAAPGKLASLLDDIICEASDAVILVAKLVGNTNTQAKTDGFNRRINSIVAERIKAGYRMRIVDMSSIRGADLGDGVHPNDSGYAKMAQKWYDALYKLPPSYYNDPLPPSQTTPVPVRRCPREKQYWYKALSGNQIAAGARVPGDKGEAANPAAEAAYQQRWPAPSGLAALGVNRDGNYVRMADLDGDGRVDYLWVDPSNGSVRAWLNRGGGTWQALNGGDPIAAGIGPAVFVFFADINGDKRADYVYVYDNRINVYFNLGPFGNIYAWSKPTTIRLPGDDVSALTMKFGDINGDGKDDFIRFNRANNVLDNFMQDGAGNIVAQDKSSVLATERPISNIFFGDIDGDGYDDMIILQQEGFMAVVPNQRNGRLTFDGTTGPTPGPGIPVSQFRLGDMNGDGRVDFIGVRENSEAFVLSNEGIRTVISSGRIYGSNFGLGGIGAAVRFADLDGDGVDDYISIGPDTQAIGYLNRGQFGENGWLWSPMNNGGLIALGHGGAKRHQIHFADLNGDGRSDYLVVDDDDASVICYFNGGITASGSVNWIPKGKVALGVAKTGEGVRFADLDGDGRADYIWLDTDGRAIVYLNTGSSDSIFWTQLNNGNPVALGVGGKRSEIQFSDIDGDGKADYLWVHPENGATDIWYSEGRFGSSWSWTPGGQLAAGIGYKGNAVRFARMLKTGRNDYLGIGSSDGSAVAYFRACLQGQGTRKRQTATCKRQPYTAVRYPSCTADYDRYCQIADCTDPASNKRDLDLRQSGGKGDYGGNSRNFDIQGLSVAFYLVSRIYPNIATFLAGTPRGASHNLFYARATSCDDTAVAFSSADQPPPGTGLQNPLPPEWRSNVDLDHPVDLQVMARFLEYAVTGRIGDNIRTNLPRIPETTLRNTWRSPNGVPTTGNQPYPVINDLVMHAFGDTASFQNFVPLRNDANAMKGTIFGALVPMDLENFRKRIRAAGDGNQQEYDRTMAMLHEFFTVFQYINVPEYITRFNAVMADIRNAFVYLQNNNTQWRGIVALWDQFATDYFQGIVDISYTWGSNALNAISEIFGERDDPIALEMLSLVGVFLEQLEDLRFDQRRPRKL